MFKKMKFGLVITLVVLLLTACGTKNDDTAEKKKDEVIIRLGTEPTEGFDPTKGWGSYGSPIFQSTLMRRNAKMEIENDLATGYEVSADGLTWTVTIRDDVKFSDGKPLTAKDVVFTYKTAQEAASTVDLTNVASIAQDGDTKVVFTLKEPRSSFVSALISLGVVPEHAYGDTYGENPIGSGAYRMVQWDKEQQVIIEPNPEYYGEKGQFKKITIVFLDEDAAIAAARAGQLDFTAIPATSANQEIEGMKKVVLDSVDNRGISWPVVPSGKENEAGVKIGNDVTSDVAIRKAVGLAVDRQSLIDGILNGYGRKANSIADGMPWFNTETEVSEKPKVEAAEKLLDEAGWVKGADGIREKNGVKAAFNIMYPSSDAVRQSLALAVADEMKALGLDVTPAGHSWDELANFLHSNPILMGWGGYDPYEMYTVYASKYAGVEWYNTGYYQNPKVDNYFEEALRATSEKEALDFWKKAQWDGETGLSSLGDEPWTWLVNIDHVYFVRDGIEIGDYKVQPHGHGWPVADNLNHWVWK